jgi:hypothetical protein
MLDAINEDDQELNVEKNKYTYVYVWEKECRAK